MMKSRILAFTAFCCLVACSQGSQRTVEKPIQDVKEAVRAGESSLYLTNVLPGASNYVETRVDDVIWHFALNGQDYAQYTIQIAARGPTSTEVAGTFEEIDDAKEPGVPFLRDNAKAVSQELVAAALEGRPINHQALQDRFKMQAATNPAAVMGAQRQYWDEAIKIGKENQSGSSSASSDTGSFEKVQPYDEEQPYDKVPAYDRN